MTWRVLFDAGPARSLRKSDPGFVRPIRAARTGLAEDPASRYKAFPGLLRSRGCSTPRAVPAVGHPPQEPGRDRPHPGGTPGLSGPPM